MPPLDLRRVALAAALVSLGLGLAAACNSSYGSTTDPPPSAGDAAGDADATLDGAPDARPHRFVHCGPVDCDLDEGAVCCTAPAAPVGQRCSTQPCAPFASGPAAVVGCDEPTDCAPGLVCCFGFAGEAPGNCGAKYFVAAKCTAPENCWPCADGGGQTFGCRSDVPGDCPAGQRCQTLPATPYTFELCQ